MRLDKQEKKEASKTFLRRKSIDQNMLFKESGLEVS